MPRWSPFDSETDQSLVKGLNEGEEEAVGALYDHYAERLYDYAVSLSDDLGAAADIVHDTFIDAVKRAPRMRNRDHLGPWLYAAVRRRCLTRVNGGLVSFDRPSGRGAGTPGSSVRQGGPADERSLDVLDAALARLDFADQELLLLVARHGLTVGDVAATRGTGRRGTGRRVAAAGSRLTAAVAAAVRELSERCAEQGHGAVSGKGSAAGGNGTAAGRNGTAAGRNGTAAGGNGAASAVARVDPGGDEPCVACHGRERSKGNATALLSLPQAPVLPAALRHRVIHTGTDPELAGYRADIAARGGNLTSAGLPRQPDLPSPMVRRWIFTGSGMAGVLATALVLLFVVKPSFPVPSIDWFDRNPPSSPTSPSPGASLSRRPLPPAAAGSRPPMAPMTHVPERKRRPTPTPSSPQPTTPPPVGPGVLQVGPDTVKIRAGQKVARLELTAYQGEVDWSATASTSQISLSSAQGTIPMGERQQIDVYLDRGLLTFPGKATITFNTLTRGPNGNITDNVTVAWSGSLF